MSKSLDPRFARLNFAINNDPTPDGNHWPTWEVFHQKKRGDQPIHVGAVHAAGPELAMVLAKETFGRRDKTANLWIVETRNVYTLDPDDEDMFETATSEDKKYREPSGFSVREKITAYKAAKAKENEIA